MIINVLSYSCIVIAMGLLLKPNRCAICWQNNEQLLNSIYCPKPIAYNG